MSQPGNKLLASLDKAADLVHKISDLLSFGINNNEVYKKVLQCRLEVQYALALLCIKCDVECQPQKIRGKPEIERDLIQISDHLSKCKEILSSGRSKEAITDLLVADTLLGQLIIWLRRGKKEPYEKTQR